MTSSKLVHSLSPPSHVFFNESVDLCLLWFYISTGPGFVRSVSGVGLVRRRNYFICFLPPSYKEEAKAWVIVGREVKSEKLLSSWFIWSVLRSICTCLYSLKVYPSNVLLIVALNFFLYYVTFVLKNALISIFTNHLITRMLYLCFE